MKIMMKNDAKNPKTNEINDAIICKNGSGFLWRVLPVSY
jgi:hypothetical protein